MRDHYSRTLACLSNPVAPVAPNKPKTLSILPAVLKNLFVISAMFLFGAHAWAVSAGDYRTCVVNGNWNANGTWEKYSVTPTVGWFPCGTGDYPGATAGAGTVTVKNNTLTLNIKPAFPIGSLVLNANMTASVTCNLDILGNVILNSGTVNLSSVNGKIASLNIGGDLTINGGTITETKNASGQISFVGTAEHTFTRTSGIIDPAATINFAVNAGSTLDVGTSIIDGGGTFDLKSGATLITANTGGISASGATGSIQTTVRTYNAGANYIFNGSSAQELGTGITAANKLTIKNPAGVRLSGNCTIGNSLILENGNLSLGAAASNLTLTNSATVSSPSAFGSGRMIVCDGSGSIIKQSTTSAGLQMLFPIGTGANYSPVSITSLSATVAGTASVNVRAVAGTPAGASSTDLQKSWILASANLSNISANLEFGYSNPSEVGLGGDQLSYTPYVNSGTNWIIPAGASSGGVNPMSVTGSNVITGTWTGLESPTTYYSYQSGNWTAPLTWTTDPSGTLSVASAVPGPLDRVVILNGRTVKMTAAQTVLSTNINEGGVLDIGSFIGHNLGAVRGKGKMKLNTGTFPAGVFTEFISANGGTVEYYNGASYTLSQLEYNNLIFNHSGAAIVATVAGNLTVNSDLTIENGVFQINSNTATTRLDLAVYGDLLVKSSGKITLGTGIIGTTTADAHRFTIQGDFTNYGNVQFTNLASPDYLNYPNQRVDVVFNNPNKNQNVQINGTTVFYRIEIDKGTDQTYILNIDASAAGLFKLHGRNNLMASVPVPAEPNINNLNALGLMSGTLRLGENIEILSLAETNCYHVDEDASLWIDGANVAGGNALALILYGKLKISNPTGSLAVSSAQGIVMRANAAIEVADGILTSPCIRTSSITGTHRGSYIQKGGVVTVTGNLSVANNHPSFSMTFPNMSFNMSGGDLYINQATSSGLATGMSLGIGANPENVSLTGGTIHIMIQNRNANIATTVPFWNLSIEKPSANGFSCTNTSFIGSGTETSSITATDLTIYHDLSVNGTAKFNANNLGVAIGGDFNLASGATYTPGTNTTTFNGNGGQTFNNLGTVNSGLYNISFENKTNTTISRNLTVRNELLIGENSTMQDMGNTISVGNNITNSGKHVSQANGSITLINGAIAHTIGGNGNGYFGNLTINKTGGAASIIADQSLTGNLRLASGSLDISTYKLAFGPLSNVYDAAIGTTAVFSGTKMIKTSGGMSDGGVSKTFSATSTFVFPFGTAADFTPASLQILSAPATWGTVNIKPVLGASKFVTSSNSLDYYWKVSSTDFSGIAANSLSYIYRYVDSDLTGRGTENNYIPGFYAPFAWQSIPDVSMVMDPTNDIKFSTVSYLDGDFTAGEPAAFQSVKVFYSRANGLWNDKNTWSTIAVGGAVDGGVPGANNPVVIGDGLGINHTVTIPSAESGKTIGGLQINAGSVLDITTTTGHNFGAIPENKVSGSGTLRISSAAPNATFPLGDFGNFLAADGGTVEYYTTGTQDFTLPAAVTAYNNLVLSPATVQTITMPSVDMTINGNYTVSGTGTEFALLNSAGPHALTIKGDLSVKSGKLGFPNGATQSIVVNGNVSIASGASFLINKSATKNQLIVAGNFVNDGTFNMYTSTSANCDVTFTGNTSNVISGTGTNIFDILTVDKGTSRDSVLNVTANNLTLKNGLILNNGTFRVNNSLLNITLSTTTAFTIPSTAALSASAGTLNIGTADNAGDLILNGRLELNNTGIVNIGTAGTAYNNDIEYASGGTPEIIVGGSAKLIVNGQIRRPLTITNGSLRYTQSGTSTVTIAGQNANNTRAMFEVLNSGSQFNMWGGKLIIARNFNNPAQNELYLAPETSSVLSGEVRIGLGASSAAATEFNIVSAIQLYNLTVDATTNVKTANIRIYPLVVKNDLKIEGNSILKANGLDVTIGHNFTNNNNSAGTGIATGGYQPGTFTQTTRFNGTLSQIIAGAGANLTNFANLTIASASTVSLAASTNTRVNGELTLSSGTLSDGGNTLTVIGNIENNAVHTSPATTGGIVMLGSLRQTVSGNGTSSFGNIQINNPLGVELADNATINGKLTFTTGALYINDYLLTLGTAASIGGTLSSANMIMLNGVISDQGVRKLFPASASDFTFPIGVAGKYTPARYNVTANTAAGAITVKPVNYRHTFTLEPTIPVANELQYYWNAQSTGFAGLAVTHEYHYDNDDAKPNETNYVVARLITDTDKWDVPATGTTVNAAGDYFTLTGVNYINGEYTCGVNIAPNPNFNDLPIYYSRNATLGGNWDVLSSWTLSPDGSGPAVTIAPKGNPIVILPGHTIKTTGDWQSAYSAVINGTLAIETTLYHNLGHISGGGTISVSSTLAGSFVIPGGEYEEFVAQPTSTFIFTNTSTSSTATLPSSIGTVYKPFPNVIFAGVGVKYTNASNMKVLGNLTIDGGTLNNTLDNKNITVLGNWTDNTASGGFVPGTGTVEFTGSAAQTLTVKNAATEPFYNFKINNAAGLTLAGGGNVSVSRILYLTKGNITTNATNMLNLTNTSSAAVSGGNSLSFVNGPLRKTINSGSSFSFPVGDGTRYGNVYMSSVSASGNYVAQYYNKSTAAAGYDPLSKVAPIDIVSDNEYWRISGEPANADVRIRWDGLSGIIPAAAQSRTKLRIVEWNGTAWASKGNIIADGGVGSGTIRTNPALSVSGDHFFTIAVESLPTINTTSSDASFCSDGIDKTDITVALTGTAPWTIKYKVNGANETTISGIYTSPFTIAIGASSPGITLPGNYIYRMTAITDATGATGIADFTKTVTIEMKEAPAPVIAGISTLPLNASTDYKVVNVTGNTYLWSISSPGVFNSGSATSTANVKFGSGANGWVNVKETAVNGCTVTTANFPITLSDIPVPKVTGKDIACNTVTETYSTPNVPGHTYLWTLPLGGGTIVGAATAASVQIKWTANGAHSVSVAEKGSIATSPTVTDILPITVNTLPLNNQLLTAPATTCINTSTEIVIKNAQSGCDYILRLDADDTELATVHAYATGDLTLPYIPAVSGATTYNIVASNEFLCALELTNKPAITVIPAMSIALSSAAATQAQDLIIGLPVTNVVFAVSNMTGVSASPLPAGVTGSLSAGQYTLSGTPTAGGTFSYTVALSGGCGAASATGSVKITDTVYSNGSNMATLSNWGTNADGSGTHPVSFAATGMKCIVPAATSGILTSNLVLGSGVTLRIDGTMTPSAAAVLSGAGTITGNGVFRVTRTAAEPSFDGQYTIANRTLSGATIEYVVPTGGQTVSGGFTCNTLRLLNTSGTNTANGNVAASIIENTSGGTLDMATYSLTGAVDNTGSAIRFGGAANGRAISNGTVEYNGAIQQVAAGTYHNLSINGVGTKTLAGAASVNGALTMTDGVLATSAANLLTLAETATVTMPLSATSYVEGPMAHTVATNAAETRIFPVGTGGIMHRLDIAVTQNNAVPTTKTTYTAEYRHSPATDLAYTLPVPKTITTVSLIGYWHVDKDNESISADGTTDSNLDSAKVILYYTEANDGVTMPAKLRIAKSNSVSGQWENIGGTATDFVTNGFVVSGAFHTFCDLSLANGVGGTNPLPISLLSFTAKASGTDAVLDWTTASELSNDFYTIEKSSNGTDFTAIATLQGAGTTSAQQHYGYTDRNAGNGIMYYHLLQTDYDGTTVVIGTKSVTIQTGATSSETLELYYAPRSSDKLHIGLGHTQTVRFDVFTATGSLVAARDAELGEGVSELLISELAQFVTGTYIITATTDTQTHTVRYCKQ